MVFINIRPQLRYIWLATGLRDGTYESSFFRGVEGIDPEMTKNFVANRLGKMLCVRSIGSEKGNELLGRKVGPEDSPSLFNRCSFAEYFLLHCTDFVFQSVSSRIDSAKFGNQFPTLLNSYRH